MSTDTESFINNKPSLEIKSNSYNVQVLVVLKTELKQIDCLLDEKIALAPEFFKNSPILIDLTEVKQLEFDLSSFIALLYKKSLFPIGLSGGSDEQNSLALELKIPLHLLRKANTPFDEPSQQITENNSRISSDEALGELVHETVESMVVLQPVRSGQRIYAKGDLIILSHVSAGAEVMAEGNIHVYGSLRGRALAGVQGNTESRIFCSALQAELISIAGNYKISEELDKTETSMHIFLKDQALIIKPL